MTITAPPHASADLPTRAEFEAIRAIPAASRTEHQHELFERGFLRGPSSLAGAPAPQRGHLLAPPWASSGPAGTTTPSGLFVPGTALPAAEPHPYDERLLDLDSLWNTEPKPNPPYQGGILGPGQQASIWGGGKVGKSLFVLEMSLRLAAGLPFLGDEPQHGPVRVLYVDRENGNDDIHQRLYALGIKPDPNLMYLSFPESLVALDVDQGAAWLSRQIDRYAPQLVVIDTASRFVAGDENDNPTWLALYRISLVILKARGIASLQIDHTGHQPRLRRDEEPKPPMPRGGSGKAQALDEGWAMWSPPAFEGEVPAGIVRLTRVVTRSGLGRDDMLVRQLGRKETLPDGTERWARGETKHELATLQPPSGPMAKPTTPAEPWFDLESVIEALADKSGWPPPGYRQAESQAYRDDLAKAARWKRTPSKAMVSKALAEMNRRGAPE